MLTVSLEPTFAMFTIATAFSNVHSAYKAGNVKLQHVLLETFQKYASEKVGRENLFSARTYGLKGVMAGETVDFFQWSLRRGAQSAD